MIPFAESLVERNICVLHFLRLRVGLCCRAFCKILLAELLGLFFELLLVDVCNYAERHLLWSELLFDKLQQLVTVDFLNRCHGAEDVAAERMTGEHHFLEFVKNVLRRGVFI